jgi:hypothetical protein
MVAAEMVLIGDALQGSRTRATTVARDGGVTGGEEDKKTERTCGGMEQKEIGPPVGTLGDVRRAQWVKEMMKSEFQIFMMGELTFFLGIQVKQTKQNTFVHQAKYMKDLIKKFNMAELKPVSTPMSTTTSFGPDEDSEVVDQREYMSMIGSLMYLTATQPDIQFAVGLCVRF